MKKLLIVMLIVALTGCATPPGKLGDSQFNWSKYSINKPVSEVHYSFVQGFRQCSDVQPVVNSFGNRVVIDVYFPGGMFETRSNKVYGQIKLKGSADHTDVEVGVLKSVDDALFTEKGKHRRLWELWSKGQIQCQ